MDHFLDPIFEHLSVNYARSDATCGRNRRCSSSCKHYYRAWQPQSLLKIFPIDGTESSEAHRSFKTIVCELMFRCGIARDVGCTRFQGSVANTDTWARMFFTVGEPFDLMWIDQFECVCLEKLASRATCIMRVEIEHIPQTLAFVSRVLPCFKTYTFLFTVCGDQSSPEMFVILESFIESRYTSNAERSELTTLSFPCVQTNFIKMLGYRRNFVTKNQRGLGKVNLGPGFTKFVSDVSENMASSSGPWSPVYNTTSSPSYNISSPLYSVSACKQSSPSYNPDSPTYNDAFSNASPAYYADSPTN